MQVRNNLRLENLRSQNALIFVRGIIMTMLNKNVLI